MKLYTGLVGKRMKVPELSVVTTNQCSAEQFEVDILRPWQLLKDVPIQLWHSRVVSINQFCRRIGVLVCRIDFHFCAHFDQYF